MAVEAKIFSCIFCIWLTSSVYCQTITGRHQDYRELSKAVDRFLNILIKEDAVDGDNTIESWETVHKEDIDPKLKILAHILRSLSSPQESTSLRDQLHPNDYIPRYLQAFLTDEEPFLDKSSSQLPSSQTIELGQTKSHERNMFWPNNPEDMFSENEEKRNGIWYGKRTSSHDEEPSKRNGIWYGKRSSLVDEKRNGIWYGKRNGIWYGKRNGIWYGKRDSGLYPEDVI